MPQARQLRQGSGLEQAVSRARSRCQRVAHPSRDDPPLLHLVLGEAALHRVVAGQDVQCAQLDWLIELGEWPHVALQVLPYSFGEHAAMGMGFTLLTLQLGEGDTTWVYVEQLTRADLSPDQGHVKPYLLTFESLAINSLGERESLALLRQTRDGLR
jgi:hypothetical protein